VVRDCSSCSAHGFEAELHGLDKNPSFLAFFYTDIQSTSG
jgi:hypothetical protein